MKTIQHFIIAVLSLSILLGCVEEIRFENESFEFFLVIDATLTDELKHQEIYINRAHRFEEQGPNEVTGATVLVLGGATTYVFQEKEPGTYVSENEFAAQPNIPYHLEITTKNGARYTSATTQLTTKTTLDNLYAKREINDDGTDGISLLVDSYDPTNTSHYYRYEFDETFKVIAPKWVDKDAFIVADNYPDCIVGLKERPVEQRTCYRTETAATVNLATTMALSEDRIEGHQVNFLSNKNYKISFRYSILVRQYVITQEAHAFWETMNSFNDQGSLFSQIQAGYIPGNIVSQTNEEERVIGFFEVATKDTKRLFFDYTDFYPTEDIPPFVIPCPQDAPGLFDISHNNRCGPIMASIRTKTLVYLMENTGQFPRGGPYIMVPRACGDCTVLGNSVPPDFWTE